MAAHPRDEFGIPLPRHTCDRCRSQFYQRSRYHCDSHEGPVAIVTGPEEGDIGVLWSRVLCGPCVAWMLRQVTDCP